MREMVCRARETAESDGDDGPGVLEATMAICLNELHDALVEEFSLPKDKQTPLVNGMMLLLSMSSIENGVCLKDVIAELNEKYTYYHMDALSERVEH